MKMLLFLTILYSSIVSANYIANSKVGTTGLTVYSDTQSCEIRESGVCSRIPQGEDPSDLKLINEMKDDESQPIYAIVGSSQDYTDATDAQSKLSALNCAEGIEAYNNESTKQVYCRELTGYNKVATGKKILVVDTEAKIARLALIAKKNQENAILQKQLSFMDFGRTLVAEIAIRNRTKAGLTTEQVVQLGNTYAPVRDALLDGSLTTAQSLVNGLSPDSIFTQEDKDFILARISAKLAE